jgi:hypothetical protein
MDELTVDPVGYRDAVFRHIGLDARECTIEPGFNRKAKELKIEIPDEYRELLRDYFAEEYERLSPFVDRTRVDWPTPQVRLPA